MSIPIHILKNGKVEINLRLIFEICDNDEEQIISLIRTFLQTSVFNIQKLQEFFTTNDLTQLKFTAHSCRSSLSVFIYQELYDLLRLIENQSKESGEVSYLYELVNRAIERYKAMIDLINSAFTINI